MSLRSPKEENVQVYMLWLGEGEGEGGHLISREITYKG